MADKIYIGNGKEKKFDNGGSIISITIDVDAVGRYFQEYGFTTEQGKGKLRLDVTERRSIDNYGNTHAVTVNTWKPDNQNGGHGARNQQHDNSVPKAGDNTTPPAGMFNEEVPDIF